MIVEAWMHIRCKPEITGQPSYLVVYKHVTHQSPIAAVNGERDTGIHFM